MAVALTAQQHEIVQAITSQKSYIPVKALAGTGKTTTIYKGLEALHKNGKLPTATIILTFLKGLTEDSKKKAIDAGIPEGYVKTFHATGRSAIVNWLHANRKNSIPKNYQPQWVENEFWENALKFAAKELDFAKNPSMMLYPEELDAEIVDGEIDIVRVRTTLSLEQQNAFVEEAQRILREPGAIYALIASNYRIRDAYAFNQGGAVMLSMDSLYRNIEENPYDGDLEMFIPWLIRQAFCHMIKGFLDTSKVSFDMMISLPVIFNMRNPQSLVVLDEIQDMDPWDRAFVKLFIGGNTKIITTGDPHQTIFQFKGVEDDAFYTANKEFADLVSAPSFNYYPLTKSFRCPKVVQEIVQYRIAEFEVSGNNCQGEIFYAGDIFEALKQGSISRSNHANIAVLSRSVLGTVLLALKAYRGGLQVRLINRKIANFAIRLKSKIDDYMNKIGRVGMPDGSTKEASEMSDYDKIDYYSRNLAAKNRAKPLAWAEKELEFCELFKFLIERNPEDNLRALIATIAKLEDKNAQGIMFATIWQVKGQEYEHVIFNGSPYKKNSTEQRLVYVGLTRAKQTITMIPSIVDSNFSSVQEIVDYMSEKDE